MRTYPDDFDDMQVILEQFYGLRKLGNICCGKKMFLNKIRNIICVPDKRED